VAETLETKPIDDLSALAWVQSELKRSLENANKALRRFLKESETAGRGDLDAADPAVLRGARAQLHQGVGALELVGLPAPARVLRAAEAAVQRLLSRPALVDEAAVQTIERVSFALLDYLARLLARKPVSPVALFPQYRDAQTLAGSDRIHPADLWEVDFRWHELAGDRKATPRAADDAARDAMESAVLGLMRRPDARTWARVGDLCAGLGAAAGGRSATLWKLGAAFAEAEAAGLLPAGDVYTKRVAARLLAQLRLDARGQDDPSERLAQDLLFFCANARTPTEVHHVPRLHEVRRAWRLHEHAPIDYHAARLGRFDPAWIAQARKRVAGAKDVWSAVAGGEEHRLAGLAEQFALLCDSVEKLFPSGATLSRALQETAAATVAAGGTPAAPLAMEVATSVLYLDATLEDGELDHPDLAARVERLAQRIDDVRGGAGANALEPWMEELYRRVSDRQTMGSVVHELRATLSEVEKQIDQYFRDPSQRELLIPVPNQLSAMRGVLSVLGMDQASQAVVHMRDDVDALAQTEVDPQQAVRAGTFDRLADNLGALSFLIDMLSVQPQLAKSLFRFDPDEGSLRAVMGQSERTSAFGGLDEVPSASGAPLLDEAREAARSVAEAPLPAVAADLERLSRQAEAAGREAIADALDSAHAALQEAPDEASRRAVGAELARSLEAIAPPAPAPAVVMPPPASATTGLEEDAEMRDIFLEEAREVVDAARASLAELQSNPEDVAELTTVRRAFHTLKGSSRMVGLRDFGEAAWACEQLYNARLAQSPRMDDELRHFTAEALDYLAGWTDAIGAGDVRGHASPPVVAAADSLRLHGVRLPVALPERAAAPAPSAPPPLPGLALPMSLPELTLPLPGPDLTLPEIEPVAAPQAVTEPAAELADATTLRLDQLPDDKTLRLPDLPVLQPEAGTGLVERVPGLPTAFDLDLSPPAAVPVAEVAEVAFELDLGETATPTAPSAEPEAAEAVLQPFDAEATEVIEVTFGETPEPAPPVLPTLSEELPPAVVTGGLPDLTDVVLPMEAGALPEQALESAATTLVPEPLAAPLVVDLGAEWPADTGPGSLPTAPMPFAPSTQAAALAPESAPVPLVHELMFGEPATPAAGPSPEAAAGPPTLEAAPLVDLAASEPEVALATGFEPPAAPQPVHEPEGLPAAGAPETPPEGLAPHAEDEQFKVIGSLRIPIPLFNIYLNEADELSRRLATEIAEWSVEHERRPVQESTVALAHSLAGNSATVGYVDLSMLARALEHALMRSVALGRGSPGEPELFAETAEEVRRLLHQFAAGFLRPMVPGLIERLAKHERSLSPVVPDTVPTVEEELEAPPPVAAEPREPSPFETTPLPVVQLAAPTFAALESTPAPEAPVGGARADAFDDEEDIDAVDATDAELFPIFEEEAEELLPQLHSRLRDWLLRPSDRAAAAACMRTLHTFKGGARLAGAMRLGEMAHRLETAIEHTAALDEVTADRIEPLLNRGDAMAAAFEALRRPGALSPQPLAMPAPPAQPMPVELPPEPAPLPLAVSAPAATEVPAAAPAAEPVPVSQPAPEAAPPPAPQVVPIDWGRFHDARVVAPPLPERVAPSASAAVRVRSGLLDRLVNHAGEVSITRARIDSDVQQLQGSLNDLTENLDRLRRHLRDIELQAESQITSRIEAAKAAAQAFDPLEMDRFTRFQELTRMMAESVNDVATVQRSVQRTLQSTEDELASQARLTRELQDDLLRTRMVEFESLADRLYRVVRQAAKDTGKPVRLDIVGGAIEVDRGVLERMVGPFEHLLRNSVAHGIEPAAVRAAAGKDPAGSITVTVSQEGNEIGVECRDDGGGLDLERIRRRGEERGLIAPGQAVSDTELANLIFVPGFSTADEVTELAGRGVGLDVVRAEVNAMGGRIETASTPGQGSSFKLVLPLTTAVTQVVMLRFGEQRIAVPSTLIEIVRRVPSEQVEQAYSSGAFQHGDQVIPFYWLGALLQHSHRGATAGRTQAVVVVRSAAQRVALHVDEVVGNQEVVVKHVGPQLARLPGLAGVTLLPSGAVALIYNPVALATLYGDTARQQALAVPSPTAEVPIAPVADEPRAPLVLVVDDSLTVRRVTQRLLQREGYRVALAKDGFDALEKLAQERPVVMLSDIEMPRMDGFDLLRNVRADPAISQLPVIMITSRIAQKHRDYAGELGADHYLGKPYSEEELLTLVARYAGADVPA